jgi:ATP-dependent DNA ligase
MFQELKNGVNTNTLPILYKKSSTGAIQTWQIQVNGDQITVSHGQLGGAIQVATETIKSGKNQGRANATTAAQQALAEAEARWTKQKKKKYVESLEDAENGEIDSTVILGGVDVMLAPSKIYPTFKHKLTFPVYVQSKYDGSRLVAVLSNGKCTLWSRTRKQVNSLPHIVKAVEERFGKKYPDLVLDGEAYSVKYHDQFEELMSLIRQSEPGPGHEKVDYHIYDVPSNKGTFSVRDRWLKDNYNCFGGPLVPVETAICHNDDEIMACHEKNLEGNFEGSMVRGDGPYEGGKRSYYLQKLKNFEEAEWPIIGAEEGRGKDAGTVGAFVCKTKDGSEFKARLRATYERRRELFNEPKQWKNKLLTIKYQQLTAYGIPRFPIGKSIRDYD